MFHTLFQNHVLERDYIIKYFGILKLPAIKITGGSFRIRENVQSGKRKLQYDKLQ